MRLFLCDDNPQYRTLARLVLERAGHDVVGEAGDGREAIERAPAAAPDVLLLDLNMPRMNGFDALPPLRDVLPETRIVVLTTGQGRDERERALGAGADGFIVKPARILALTDELDAALDSAARGAARGPRRASSRRPRPCSCARRRPRPRRRGRASSPVMPEMSSRRARGAASRSRGKSVSDVTSRSR